MQYYHHPENTDADEMIFSMRKLFSAFMVKQLNILGGEPFVCQKNLVRILEYLNEEAGGRYGEVVIITNGTIIPSEECLNIMKTTPRLKVLFSNYGELSSKLEEFTGICKRMGIASDVVDTEFWWDFGDLSQLCAKLRYNMGIIIIMIVHIAGDGNDIGIQTPHPFNKIFVMFAELVKVQIAQLHNAERRINIV